MHLYVSVQLFEHENKYADKYMCIVFIYVQIAKWGGEGGGRGREGRSDRVHKVSENLGKLRCLFLNLESLGKMAFSVKVLNFFIFHNNGKHIICRRAI